MWKLEGREKNQKILFQKPAKWLANKFFFRRKINFQSLFVLMIFNRFFSNPINLLFSTKTKRNLFIIIIINKIPNHHGYLSFGVNDCHSVQKFDFFFLINRRLDIFLSFFRFSLSLDWRCRNILNIFKLNFFCFVCCRLIPGTILFCLVVERVNFFLFYCFHLWKDF